jgi:hypothetical protein
LPSRPALIEFDALEALAVDSGHGGLEQRRPTASVALVGYSDGPGWPKSSIWSAA